MKIFGYGSLIGPDGINGRGMLRKYTNQDLTECVLRGYKREFNAEGYGYRWLGIISSPDYTTNGVVFDLDEQDLSAFKETEGFDLDIPTYELIDVSESLDVQFDEPVFACVTMFPAYNQAISRFYLPGIMKSLKLRSEKFQQEFYT